MNAPSILRRRLLALLLGGSTALLAQHAWIEAASATDGLLLRLPEAGKAETVSFSVFYALSQLVTLREQLVEPVARRMFPLFMEEPWGRHHIHSTYAQLLVLLGVSTGKLVHIHPVAFDRLGKGQAWFASHLLTTWYLGVYYHESSVPVRVAHSEALMYAAVAPVLPAPFAGATGYGLWGEPP